MDQIINLFSQKIKDKLQSHVKNIYLYGSRARGDFNDGSDYDFLIIVDKRDHEMSDFVIDESVKILNNYNELISVIIYEEQEWDFKKYIPLGKNILKEGILLWIKTRKWLYLRL